MMFVFGVGGFGRRKYETPAFPKTAIHLSPVFSQASMYVA